jgi:MtN3 and saliva related transmembrane protein
MEHIVTVIGVVAGLASTTSFVPQLVKAWKGEQTEGISLHMFMLTVTAFTLWSVYGFLIGSWVLLTFNLISLALASAILLLRWRAGRASA